MITPIVTDRPTKAYATHLSAVRERNQADLRYRDAVNVAVEHLEVLSIKVALRKETITNSVLRADATRLVDAVMAQLNADRRPS